MAQPIVLIKMSRLVTPKDYEETVDKLKKHTISSEYHVLLVPCLDSTDVQLEIHNDSEATETTVEELKQHVESLINETK